MAYKRSRFAGNAALIPAYLAALRRGEAFAMMPPDLWILDWQMLRPY
ncbi:MAG: hypothetical protein HYZ50_05000 [Deltaproteobacteria bacterium]|nr:hypothetical protein [Deltaproteobacteria bacterium]